MLKINELPDGRLSLTWEGEYNDPILKEYADHGRIHGYSWPYKNALPAGVNDEAWICQQIKKVGGYTVVLGNLIAMHGSVLVIKGEWSDISINGRGEIHAPFYYLDAALSTAEAMMKEKGRIAAFFAAPYWYYDRYALDSYIMALLEGTHRGTGMIWDIGPHDPEAK
jgi:hypothetical protein